jgi:hypothetical protein
VQLNQNQDIIFTLVQCILNMTNVDCTKTYCAQRHIDFGIFTPVEPTLDIRNPSTVSWSRVYTNRKCQNILHSGCSLSDIKASNGINSFLFWNWNEIKICTKSVSSFNGEAFNVDYVLIFIILIKVTSYIRLLTWTKRRIK